MNVTRRGFFGFLAMLPFVPKTRFSPPPSAPFVAAPFANLVDPKLRTFFASEVIRSADLNAEFDKIMGVNIERSLLKDDIYMRSL